MSMYMRSVFEARDQLTSTDVIQVGSEVYEVYFRHTVQHNAKPEYHHNSNHCSPTPQCK